MAEMEGRIKGKENHIIDIFLLRENHRHAFNPRSDSGGGGIPYSRASIKSKSNV